MDGRARWRAARAGGALRERAIAKPDQQPSRSAIGLGRSVAGGVGSRRAWGLARVRRDG
jgi:hypothetical protein